MASLDTWPAGDRPRERLRRKGATALGDSELLALVLGSGNGRDNAVDTARRILGEVGGIERLAQQGLGALSRIPGMGEAKASRVIAAAELGVRTIERRAGSNGPGRFSSSADVHAAFCARLSPLRQEVFLAVGTNNRNEAIREVVVAKGSLCDCRVEPREVFRPMIAEAAARIVLVHNHPSGDPSPSPEDVSLTRRLARVGEIVGIPILDHVVIGNGSYASLRDMGLLGGS